MFDCDAEALVNTVNTVGVMGKGIALQFKQRFPANFALYAEACRNGEVQVGKMFVTSTNHMLNPRWIINFPTKKHWIHKSSYTYIENGLDDLADQIRKLHIRSIAIPPLGAGQGGLDWRIVKQIILSKLGHLDCDILIFEPAPLINYDQIAQDTVLTKPRAMVLTLIAHYKRLGYEISLLEIQKLAYFLQRMGQQDLKLYYKKYLYGPYAHNLQHLLHELEKGYINTEKSIFDSKPLDLVSINHEKLEAIRRFVEQECSEEEKNRLDYLYQLMSGYESPFGLELLSTVDWIMQANAGLILDAEVIKEKIKDWSNRKNDSFSLNHVRMAQARLLEFKNKLAN